MRPSPSDDPVMNTRATAAPPLVATIRPTIPNGFPAPRARPLRSVLGILTNDISAFTGSREPLSAGRERRDRRRGFAVRDRGGAVAGAINESSISSAAAASWRPALITSRLGSRLIDTHWRHARLAPAGDEAR
jgi:hypothetical protein